MTAQTIRVPESVPSDPTEVTVALEVASAVWDKGDGPDAIRWLMRAIEAAEDAGDTSRADALMRAVADIGRAMETPAGTPASPPAEASGPREAAPPPPLPKSASSLPPAQHRPPPPSAIPRPLTQQPPPPQAPPAPPSVISHAPPPAVASHAPPAPLPSVTPHAPPPAPSTTVRPHTQQPPPPTSMTPHAYPQQPPLRPSTMPQPSSQLVATAAADVVGTPIRVSVRRSALDPNLWVVRLLSEGASPPAGARAGTLVLQGVEEDEEGEDENDASNGSAVG